MLNRIEKPKDKRKKCINVNVKCVFTFSPNSVRNVTCFDKQSASIVRETIGRRAKLHLDDRVQCPLFPSYSNRSWKESTNLITSPRQLYIFNVSAFSKSQVLWCGWKRCRHEGSWHICATFDCEHAKNKVYEFTQKKVFSLRVDKVALHCPFDYSSVLWSFVNLLFELISVSWTL